MICVIRSRLASQKTMKSQIPHTLTIAGDLGVQRSFGQQYGLLLKQCRNWTESFRSPQLEVKAVG